MLKSFGGLLLKGFIPLGKVLLKRRLEIKRPSDKKGVCQLKWVYSYKMFFCLNEFAQGSLGRLFVISHPKRVIVDIA